MVIMGTPGNYGNYGDMVIMVIMGTPYRIMILLLNFFFLPRSFWTGLMWS